MSHLSRTAAPYVAALGAVAMTLSLAACNDEPAAPAATDLQNETLSKIEPEGTLQGEQARYSYTIGYQVGASLQERLEDIDADALAQGVKEALTGNDARLNPEEMQAALQGYQQAQAKKAQERMQAAAAEGSAFLEQNRSKEGVKETDSGLQYQVIESGSGPQPAADDTVKVHYRGTLLDGTEFDSSYARGEPVTLPVSGVIPGWQEALQMMQEGAKWKIFVPPQLAYGEQGAGDAIGPNETLVFEVELLEVEQQQAGDDGQGQADPAAETEQQPEQESSPAQQ